MKKLSINEWAKLKVDFGMNSYYEMRNGESAREVKKELKKAFDELGQKVEFGNVEKVSNRWKSSGGLGKSSDYRKFFVKLIKD